MDHDVATYVSGFIWNSLADISPTSVRVEIEYGNLYVVYSPVDKLGTRQDLYDLAQPFVFLFIPSTRAIPSPTFSS
jgi:hypothetical protein